MAPPAFFFIIIIVIIIIESLDVIEYREKKTKNAKTKLSLESENEKKKNFFPRARQFFSSCSLLSSIVDRYEEMIFLVACLLLLLLLFTAYCYMIVSSKLKIFLFYFSK